MLRIPLNLQEVLYSCTNAMQHFSDLAFLRKLNKFVELLCKIDWLQIADIFEPSLFEEPLLYTTEINKFALTLLIKIFCKKKRKLNYVKNDSHSWH